MEEKFIAFIYGNNILYFFISFNRSCTQCISSLNVIGNGC